jgi:toxin-antitoxin system PIN domain toxin
VTYLLDVNILIALIDPTHINHARMHDWFEADGRRSWATCPITENGAIRIVSNPQYFNSPTAPSVVVASMQSLLAQPGHVFWPDDISLLDSAKIDSSRLLTAAQVTDSYLLALAQAHNGKLATLDRRLIVDAVVGGASALHLIE